MKGILNRIETFKKHLLFENIVFLIPFSPTLIKEYFHNYKWMFKYYGVVQKKKEGTFLNLFLVELKPCYWDQ